MSSALSNIPDFKPKSFWNRPEGTPGMILAVALIGAGVYGLSLILPMLLAVTWGLVQLSVGIGVLLGIAWLVTNRRFWTLGGYIFRSIARAIASTYATVDPIGIMKNYVEDLKSLLGDLRSGIERLVGMKKKIQTIMARNDRERTMAMRGLAQAKSQFEQDRADVASQRNLILYARQAGRRKDTGMTYQNLLAKLEMMEKVFHRIDASCEFMITDTEDEVKVRSDEYETIKAAEGVVGSAKKILSGIPLKKELFDMATEEVANRVARGYASLDEFRRVSDRFLNTVDLENGVFEEDALAELDSWQQRADKAVLGDDADKVLAALGAGSETVMQTDSAPIPVAASERMRNLIKGNPNPSQ